MSPHLTGRFIGTTIELLAAPPQRWSSVTQLGSLSTIRPLSTLRPCARSVSVQAVKPRAGYSRPLSSGRSVVLTPRLASSASSSAILLRRAFHASRPTRLPHIPLMIWLAGFLKSSAALNAISIFGRFSFSLLPFTWIRERMSSKWTQVADQHPGMVEHPKWAYRVEMMRKQIKPLRYMLWTLGLAPIVLIALTCIVSMERAPITGRWRMIMLSPEEEEHISKDLVGYGWFASVVKQVTENSESGVPQTVPPTDWRWQWVEQTLRRLEAGIAVIPEADGQVPSQAALAYYSHPHDGPIPPPPRYPLLPRPRLSQLMHSIPVTVDADDTTVHDAQHPEHHSHHVAPHALLGPPYQILVLEKPECNAFSHGYGPNGAGGIVLYTGFLDEILNTTRKTETAPPPNTGGLLSSLLSGLRGPSPPRNPTPTPEQTEALAVVLAHELSHLILCHHLESLSSTLVVMPTLFSMLGDIGRTVLFPMTMIFGPFLNDAIANVFKVGHREMEKVQLNCRTRELEIEADVVSARLLAYAGFDPRCAVKFWESRKGSTDLRSNASIGGPERSDFEGGNHPLSEVRLAELTAELARWERDKGS